MRVEVANDTNVLVGKYPGGAMDIIAVFEHVDDAEWFRTLLEQHGRHDTYEVLTLDYIERGGNLT